MKRLRSYAPMSKRSDKVADGEAAFAAVYARVNARSEGRCEVTQEVPVGRARCPRRAVEHHHLFKPRRSHHTEAEVVHICRPCHDRTEYPYTRGRLCYLGRAAEAFLFALRYAADKLAAGRLTE